MNQLYPIIRRARRPLTPPADPAPVLPPAAVEPPPVVPPLGAVVEATPVPVTEPVLAGRPRKERKRAETAAT